MTLKAKLHDIQAIIDFIQHIDDLKGVLRKTKVLGGQRQENAAEHSWHVIMMALCFKDYANEEIDIGKVIKMLAVHELGEIACGDSFLYDAAKRAAATEKERQAVFEMTEDLPDSLRQEIRDLWEESETGNTPEAYYMRAIDRFQPFLTNISQGGGTWKTLGITQAMALDKNAHIEKGSKILWDIYQDLAMQAEQKNYFHR